jgi:hypothetical protein
VDSNAAVGTGRGRLCGFRTVVDVKEFKGAEDGVLLAARTAPLFTVSWHGGTRDDAKGVAMGLFESFRGDRAMREFETALGASQHPTGHVSALLRGSLF